jgi:prefoldin alpha subunit
VVSDVDESAGREMQMLQQYLNEFSQRAEILARQLEMIEQRRYESLAAIETLGAFKENPEETVLLPIGGGASLRVRVVDPDSILLDIGSDVTVARDNSHSIDFLQDRIREMEAMAQKLNASIQQIQMQANEVVRRIEAAYRQPSQ